MGFSETVHAPVESSNPRLLRVRYRNKTEDGAKYRMHDRSLSDST